MQARSIAVKQLGTRLFEWVVTLYGEPYVTRGFRFAVASMLFANGVRIVVPAPFKAVQNEGPAAQQYLAQWLKNRLSNGRNNGDEGSYGTVRLLSANATGCMGSKMSATVIDVDKLDTELEGVDKDSKAWYAALAGKETNKAADETGPNEAGEAGPMESSTTEAGSETGSPNQLQSAGNTAQSNDENYKLKEELARLKAKLSSQAALAPQQPGMRLVASPFAHLSPTVAHFHGRIPAVTGPLVGRNDGAADGADLELQHAEAGVLNSVPTSAESAALEEAATADEDGEANAGDSKRQGRRGIKRKSVEKELDPKDPCSVEAQSKPDFSTIEEGDPLLPPPEKELPPLAGNATDVGRYVMVPISLWEEYRETDKTIGFRALIKKYNSKNSSYNLSMKAGAVPTQPHCPCFAPCPWPAPARKLPLHHPQKTNTYKKTSSVTMAAKEIMMWKILSDVAA